MIYNTHKHLYIKVRKIRGKEWKNNEEHDQLTCLELSGQIYQFQY